MKPQLPVVSDQLKPMVGILVALRVEDQHVPAGITPTKQPPASQPTQPDQKPSVSKDEDSKKEPPPEKKSDKSKKTSQVKSSDKQKPKEKVH